MLDRIEAAPSTNRQFHAPDLCRAIGQVAYDARVPDVIRRFGFPRVTAMLAAHGRTVPAGEISRWESMSEHIFSLDFSDLAPGNMTQVRPNWAVTGFRPTPDQRTYQQLALRVAAFSDFPKAHVNGIGLTGCM